MNSTGITWSVVAGGGRRGRASRSAPAGHPKSSTTPECTLLTPNDGSERGRRPRQCERSCTASAHTKVLASFNARADRVQHAVDTEHLGVRRRGAVNALRARRLPGRHVRTVVGRPKTVTLAFPMSAACLLSLRPSIPLVLRRSTTGPMRRQRAHSAPRACLSRTSERIIHGSCALRLSPVVRSKRSSTPSPHTKRQPAVPSSWTSATPQRLRHRVPWTRRCSCRATRLALQILAVCSTTKGSARSRELTDQMPHRFAVDVHEHRSVANFGTGASVPRRRAPARGRRSGPRPWRSSASGSASTRAWMRSARSVNLAAAREGRPPRALPRSARRRR